LRGLGLDSLEAGKRSLDAFWIDMNRLFEQFVERMTRDALGGEGWHVEAQTTESAAIVDAETGEARRAVRPDLVLTSEHARGGRLPIDAKYKPLDTRPPMADLRQAALYARVFGGNETARPDAVLVYPSGPGEEETRLDRLAIREFDGVDRVEIAILATSVRTLLACDDGGRRRRSIWRRTLDSSEDMR
jgi:5-methylcytosine-specific restriction endonuclease McrBC regulatory subunit McrC